MAAAALLLCLIPSARAGMAALCNRLLEASEAVNAYAYRRFPAAAESSPALAAALLSVAGAAYGALLVVSGNRPAALLTAFLLAGGQAYFGLSFAPPVNVALFGALGLLAVRPVSMKAGAAYAAALLAVSLAVAALWPGVDAAVEAASERARDWLGRAGQTAEGALLEMPQGGAETRHVHTRSLIEGEGAARPERAFRLETVDEERIARPDWIDYVKIILLLLLTGLAVFLPLMPLMALAARRKKALAAKRAFQSGDVSEAVCAAFRQTAAWLEAMNLGAGNLPYRAWETRLEEVMPPEYAARFGQCAALFEEALYSDHALEEDARRQVLELLDETERLLTARANARQRFRLRYKECLLT